MPVTPGAASGRQAQNAALTQKQGVFVEAYVRNGGRGTETAIQAGYPKLLRVVRWPAE